MRGIVHVPLNSGNEYGPAFAGAVARSPKKSGPQAALYTQASNSERCVDALACHMVVVLQFVFVAANLPIQLVHQLVDGGVEILM
jgi:hypothetical protein